MREHEERCGGKARYDFIFRQRPDSYIMTPIDLTAIAAHFELHVGRSAILTGNDAAWLLHRSNWAALSRLLPGRLRCHPRCDGRSTPLIRKHWSNFNEYCLMVSAFAEAGLLHVESSHPSESWLRLTHLGEEDDAASVLRQLDARSWRLARFSGQGIWGRSSLHAINPTAVLKQLNRLRSRSLEEETVPTGRHTKTVPTNSKQQAHQNARKTALEWYVRSILLGGVTCHAKASLTRKVTREECAAANGRHDEWGYNGRLGEIECTSCSNAQELLMDGKHNWKWMGTLGSDLAAAYHRELGQQAQSSNWSDIELLEPACPKQVDLLAMKSRETARHGTAGADLWRAGFKTQPWPLPVTSGHSRDGIETERMRRRTDSLNALGFGRLALAEERCKVFASNSSPCNELDLELNAGCSTLIALHPLADQAGGAPAAFGFEAAQKVWDDRCNEYHRTTDVIS